MQCLKNVFITLKTSKILEVPRVHFSASLMSHVRITKFTFLGPATANNRPSHFLIQCPEIKQLREDEEEVLTNNAEANGALCEQHKQSGTLTMLIKPKPLKMRRSKLTRNQKIKMEPNQKYAIYAQNRWTKNTGLWPSVIIVLAMFVH